MIRQKDYKRVPLDAIRPNPTQPRRDFPRDSMEKLAKSIGDVGLIEDIVLRQANGAYEIVCGERRWRAARMAGLKEISAKIVEISDEELPYVALAENLHRENLTDVRLGFIYRDLERRGLKEQGIAERLGLADQDVVEKLGLLDQSSIVEFQERELQRLRDRVGQLEAEVAGIRAELGARQSAPAPARPIAH
jgi:ParB family chromosome partitioning protein